MDFDLIIITLVMAYLALLYVMLYSVKVSDDRLGVAVKTVLGILFIIIALYYTQDLNGNEKYVITALVLCWVGDILLGLFRLYDMNIWTMFCAAVVIFMIGQIFYAEVTWRYGGFVYVSLAIALLMVLAMYYLEKDIIRNSKAAKFTLVYAFFVSLTMVNAVLCIIADLMPQYRPFMMLFTVGAVLFWISDGVLFGIVFDRPNYNVKLDYLNKSTYYIGQLLIALSVALI